MWEVGSTANAFDPDLNETRFDSTADAKAEFSGRRRQMLLQRDLHCRAGRTDMPSPKQGNENLNRIYSNGTLLKYGIILVVLSCLATFSSTGIKRLCGQKGKTIMCCNHNVIIPF